MKPSLKAFDAGFARAAATPARPPLTPEAGRRAASAALDGRPTAPDAARRGRAGRARAARCASARAARAHDAHFPAERSPILVEGVRRTIDYQDPAYAELYLDRLERIRDLDARRAELLTETARHLALWMTLRGHDPRRRAEDPRLALRPRARRGARPRRPVARHQRVHAPAAAGDLRDAAGRRSAAGCWRRAGRGASSSASRAKGRVVTTSSLRGFLMLYAVAGLKRWRRTHAALCASRRSASSTGSADRERRPRQSATGHRSGAVPAPRQGLQRHACARPAQLRNADGVSCERRAATLAPATLRELREAALADERGDRLRATLGRHGLVGLIRETDRPLLRHPGPGRPRPCSHPGRDRHEPITPSCRAFAPHDRVVPALLERQAERVRRAPACSSPARRGGAIAMSSGSPPATVPRCRGRHPARRSGGAAVLQPGRVHADVPRLRMDRCRRGSDQHRVARRAAAARPRQFGRAPAGRRGRLPRRRALARRGRSSDGEDLARRREQAGSDRGASCTVSAARRAGPQGGSCAPATRLAILYTSGTTGPVEGRLLPARAVLLVGRPQQRTARPAGRRDAADDAAAVPHQCAERFLPGAAHRLDAGRREALLGVGVLELAGRAPAPR